MKTLNRAGAFLLLITSAVLAQGRPGDHPPPPPDRNGEPRGDFHHGPDRDNRPPGPQGRWWSNPERVRDLNITPDQQKKMDDIFQQNRLRLVDLTAALQKDDMTMEPLMASETPDEPKILAQIDRVAQDRAELEKANARFLLGIRRVLTPDQWKKLQVNRPEAGHDRGPGPRQPPPRDRE